MQYRELIDFFTHNGFVLDYEKTENWFDFSNVHVMWNNEEVALIESDCITLPKIDPRAYEYLGRMVYGWRQFGFSLDCIDLNLLKNLHDAEKIALRRKRSQQMHEAYESFKKSL